MIGPCLCGDPYCPSCGNPAQAKYEDWCAEFTDKLIDLSLTEGECIFIAALVPAALEAFRSGVKDEVAVRSEGDYYTIDHLKSQISSLNKVGSLMFSRMKQMRDDPAHYDSDGEDEILQDWKDLGAQLKGYPCEPE